MWGSSGILTSDCVIYPCSVSFNAETHNFPREPQYVGTKERGKGGLAVSRLRCTRPLFISSYCGRLVTEVKLKGKVASTLPLKNVGNYYHWMCEVRLAVDKSLCGTSNVTISLRLESINHCSTTLAQGLVRALYLFDEVIEPAGYKKFKLLVPGNAGAFLRDSLKV